ncbi:MAG: penicillin-binding protein 2, partial [Deltaproteobacteria bacterium]|nr:penicillin-binding protein 2 [Deltaproteobacteria bacterium]
GLEGNYYDEVARGNRIRVIPQPAPRGIIYDRNGEILAYNRPSFDLQLIREDTPNLTLTLGNLSRITGLSAAEFRGIIQENRRNPKFKPIVLMQDIGRKLADLVDTYQEELPGISVAVEAKRLYPTASLSVHSLGYVGLITEEQLSALPLNRLYSGRVVGQSGVELTQNEDLIGLDGGRQVEVDHLGRELRVLSKPVFPVPGNDIFLTVDLRLQRYIRKLMTGLKGVVLVSRSRTGEILAMISSPDFDPNLFIGGIEGKDWRRITSGEERPLINKALQGLYPPGSTFKMVVAAAALDKGVIEEDTKLNCPGYFRVGKEYRYCWKRSGHGEVTVRQAIEQSCNVFFYQLGMMLGPDVIREYARLFGFDQPTGIELESEKSGLIPNKEWKERVLKERWYDGETPSVAIGQGYISVTPIQLLNYLNIIANGGLQVQPTIIRRVVSSAGKVLLSEDELPVKTHLLPIPLNVFNILREGMMMAVNKNGTAGRARSARFTIAGKTGTSQVIGRKGKAKRNEDQEEDTYLPHSLFVGMAPSENPLITVMVLVEHGEEGGKIAAPIARNVLEFYDEVIEPLQTLSPEKYLERKKELEEELNRTAPFRKRLADEFDAESVEMER